MGDFASSQILNEIFYKATNFNCSSHAALKLTEGGTINALLLCLGTYLFFDDLGKELSSEMGSFAEPDDKDMNDSFLVLLSHFLRNQHKILQMHVYIVIQCNYSS